MLPGSFRGLTAAGFGATVGRAAAGADCVGAALWMTGADAGDSLTCSRAHAASKIPNNPASASLPNLAPFICSLPMLAQRLSLHYGPIVPGPSSQGCGVVYCY